jgi:hypothetical protein
VATARVALPIRVYCRSSETTTRTATPTAATITSFGVMSNGPTVQGFTAAYCE